jgi:serine/threonine-protein kinase
MVAGSPLYMAPEQVLHGQPPDRRTDIYSLGAVAYFLLTGQPPFRGGNAMEVMIAHARDAVVPPSQVRPGIAADLEEVVLRCLAKKPSDRYPDTPSLAQALSDCADAANWSPRHAAEWWHAHQAVQEVEPEPMPAEPGSQAGEFKQRTVTGSDSTAVVLQPVETPRLI